MFRRALAAVAAGLVVVGAAVAADGLRTVEGNGVSLRVAPDWVRVPRADDRRLTDPRTLLVVGTHGVRPIETECQVASYRDPGRGRRRRRDRLEEDSRSRTSPGRESLSPGTRAWLLRVFEGARDRGAKSSWGAHVPAQRMVGDRAERSTPGGAGDGIMEPARVFPRPAWLAYLATNDVRGAAARAAGQGAETILEPTDVPAASRSPCCGIPSAHHSACTARSIDS